MDSVSTLSCTLNSVESSARFRSVVMAVTYGEQTHTRSLRPGESLVIGRGERADLCVVDPSLSRHHARLSHLGSAVTIEDLRSHNGTRLNGKKTRRAELSDGDRVTLGRVVVTLHGLSRPGQTTEAARPLRTADATACVPVVASPAMNRLYQQARRLGSRSLPVLILGETGTGKELVARELHGGRVGPTRPFVVVNCAAIPSQLIESALFGHVRGAFTGADRAHTGVFQSAEGGTVFLDEIGELTLPVQAALLRVLETHRVQPVGSNCDIAVNFRVLAATHRNLSRMVAEGIFREDLYHRLNGVTLVVPSLRERQEEIPALVDFFLNATAPGRALSDEAMSLLKAYDWPGNVRELRNVIEHAVALSDDDPIGADAIPGSVRCAFPTRRARPLPSAEDDAFDLRSAVQVHEATLIRQALELASGNQRRAAALLRIPLRTLERKLRRLAELPSSHRRGTEPREAAPNTRG